MSFLDINLENVPEFRVVDEGEYQIRCSSAEIRKSEKTGGNFVMLRFDVVGEPEVKDITHVMMLPTPENDEKQALRRKRALLDALEACDVSFNATDGFDVNEFVGQECWAHLVKEEDVQYGESNRIRKFVKSAN